MRISRSYFDLFMDRNLPAYEELFAMLGHPWLSNRAGLAVATRSLWIPPEHGGKLPADYSEKQLTDALPLVAGTGIFDAQTPPRLGRPAIWYLTGQKFGGMLASWPLLESTKDKVIVSQGIMALGERERRNYIDGNPDRIMDGSLEHILAVAEARNVRNHPWVRAQLALPIPFRTEHELGILSALCYFGFNVSFPLFMAPYAGLGHTHLLIEETPFTVTGALAQERDGLPRPTASSAAGTAMDIVPIPACPIFIVASGPPHTNRVVASVGRKIWGIYADAEIYSVGQSGTVVDRDPVYAASLGLHELALHVGNTTEARLARGV